MGNWDNEHRLCAAGCHNPAPWPGPVLCRDCVVAYIRPNTGDHPDHPPVEGGYRGDPADADAPATERLASSALAEHDFGAESPDAPSPRATVIAEAMLRDAVRTDPPRATRKLPTPEDDAERKAIPVWSGCVRYFPSALLEVAKVSKAGNDQHNPGQPLHWAQGKSMNQVDTAARHLLDADAVEGTPEEISHLAQAAWRVLARLQLACQREGAPLAPGARSPEGA